MMREHLEEDEMPLPPAPAGQEALLAGLYTSMKYVLLELRELKVARNQFETRMDTRVARLEDAMHTMTDWREESLQAALNRRGLRTSLLMVVLAGSVTGVLSFAGWIGALISGHVQWHP